MLMAPESNKQMNTDIVPLENQQFSNSRFETEGRRAFFKHNQGGRSWEKELIKYVSFVFCS